MRCSLLCRSWCYTSTRFSYHYSHSYLLIVITAKNPVILLNFLVWTLCGMPSFRIVSGESLKTMRELCLSTKFPRQKIRWNYWIFRSLLCHNLRFVGVLLKNYLCICKTICPEIFHSYKLATLKPWNVCPTTLMLYFAFCK